MHQVSEVIEKLEKLLTEVPGKLNHFSSSEISHKLNPEKWSKKEILGHLCDSCLNNLQRVVRVQYEDKPFIIYNQDEWVKIQNYQNQTGEEITELWVNLHRQFIRVLKTFPQSKLDDIIDVGEEVTVKFVIIDYLRHQYHHMEQIFK